MNATASITALAVLACWTTQAAQSQGSDGGLRVYGALVDYEARTIEISGQGFDFQPGSLSVALEGYGDLTRACLVDVSALPHRISCGFWGWLPPDGDHKLTVERSRHRYTVPVHLEKPLGWPEPSGPIQVEGQGRRPVAGLRISAALMDFEARTIEVSGEDLDFGPLAISLQSFSQEFGDISALCRVDASARPHRISCGFPSQGLSKDVRYYDLTIAKGGHSYTFTIDTDDPNRETEAAADFRSDPSGPGIQGRPGGQIPHPSGGLQITESYLDLETQTIEITGENFDSRPGPLTVSMEGFGDITSHCREDLSVLPHRISCDFPGQEPSPDAAYYAITLTKGGQSSDLTILVTHPVLLQLGRIDQGLRPCQTILLHGLPDPQKYLESSVRRRMEADPETVPPYVPCPCNVPAVIREDDWPAGAKIRVACTATCTAAIVMSNETQQPYLDASKEFVFFKWTLKYSCHAETPLRWLAGTTGLELESLSACSYAVLDYLRELREARPDLIFTGDDLDACQPIR